MKWIVVISVSLFLTFTGLAVSYSADKWTTEDIMLEVTALGLKAIDWRQTRTIAKHPNLYWETNPILGEHPSIEAINRYFITTALGHVFITHLLPQKYRKYWQLLWIGISANCVYHNYRIGIKIDW